MADLVQCVNDNILGKGIEPNQVYKGMKYNTSEGKYYVIHNLIDNDIIGKFSREDFEPIKSVTLEDIIQENSGKIFLAIGSKDKILIKKHGCLAQTNTVPKNNLKLFH